MSRHKHYPGSPASEPALDISSLIDVCFLLLIYFITTSTITPRESDLSVDMASRQPPITLQPAIHPLLVRIGEDDTIRVGLDSSEALDSNPASRKLPLLEARLELYRDGAEASGSLPMVRIQTHENCSHQRVTDVLNAMAGAGISNIDLVDDHPE